MSYLNELQPSTPRKTHKRLGRGIGSGKGKTCGRGHKGQKSRSGGFHKIGFEGGQMPLHRRIPKLGFTSRKGLVRQQIRLEVLNKLTSNEVTLATLKEAGLIRHNTKHVKIMLKGEINKPFAVKGLLVSKSATLAIQKAGGSVE